MSSVSMSSYSYFCRDIQNKHPEYFQNVDKISMLIKLWNELDHETKNKYNELENNEKIQKYQTIKEKNQRIQKGYENFKTWREIGAKIHKFKKIVNNPLNLAKYLKLPNQFHKPCLKIPEFITNYDKFVNIFENANIEYDDNLHKHDVVNTIKELLNLCEKNKGSELKAVISIITFELLDTLKYSQFRKSYLKFDNTVKKKLSEFAMLKVLNIGQYIKDTYEYDKYFLKKIKNKEIDEKYGKFQEFSYSQFVHKESKRLLLSKRMLSPTTSIKKELFKKIKNNWNFLKNHKKEMDMFRYLLESV